MHEKVRCAQSAAQGCTKDAYQHHVLFFHAADVEKQKRTTIGNVLQGSAQAYIIPLASDLAKARCGQVRLAVDRRPDTFTVSDARQGLTNTVPFSSFLNKTKRISFSYMRASIYLFRSDPRIM
jgi:hypothetical protein